MAELLLNNLRRTNLGNEGVPSFDDHAVFEQSGYLKAVSIFDPRRIGCDASDTPTPNGIEEAHLAPHLYIIRIVHSRRNEKRYSECSLAHTPEKLKDS